MLIVTAQLVPCASTAACERRQYIHFASPHSIASSGWVVLDWDPSKSQFVEGTSRVDCIEYPATLEPRIRNGAIKFEPAVPQGVREWALIEREVAAIGPEACDGRPRSGPEPLALYPKAASTKPSTIRVGPNKRVVIVSVVSQAIAEPDGGLRPHLFRYGVRIGNHKWYATPPTLQRVGYSFNEVGVGSRATEARLWVAEAPNHLVAYSAALERLGGVGIPDFAFVDPARILVNRRGQLLIPVTRDSVWIWDGASWRQRTRSPNASYLLRGSCDRKWYLGAADSSAFLLETSTISWQGALDVDSAYNAARFEETDFDLKPRHAIFDLPYERCEDNPSPVAALTEPCEEAGVVASNGVVDSFFVLDRMVPRATRSEGSVAQAEGANTLFVRTQAGWRSRGERSAQLYFDRGETQIGSIGDFACCGWSNENSNQSWIVRQGVQVVFFDEWPRYHNEHSDVSFFTDNLAPAPDRRAIGFTIRGDGTLHASADEPPDSLELRRVKASLAELPVAEVDALDPIPSTLWRAEHAEFVGWLDRDRVLILEQGALAVVDVRTGRRSDSGIRVRKIQDVLMVAP